MVICGAHPFLFRFCPPPHPCLSHLFIFIHSFSLTHSLSKTPTLFLLKDQKNPQSHFFSNTLLFTELISWARVSLFLLHIPPQCSSFTPTIFLHFFHYQKWLKKIQLWFSHFCFFLLFSVQFRLLLHLQVSVYTHSWILLHVFLEASAILDLYFLLAVLCKQKSWMCLFQMLLQSWWNGFGQSNPVLKLVCIMDLCDVMPFYFTTPFWFFFLILNFWR